MSGPNTQYDPVEVNALDPAVIDSAVEAALAAITAAGDLATLKEVRLAHTGDRAPISLANREIGALPPSAKAEAGKRVGQAKGRVQQALATRQTELEEARDAALLVEEAIDVTAVADRIPLGRRHPVEMMLQALVDPFVAMGWRVAEGPLVESEWFNFDALNIDPDHPARGVMDTFFVAGQGQEGEGAASEESSTLVLRTHTSPVQVRTLLEHGAPVYVVVPGRVARTDELDATHLPVFHQIEGLAIDRGLSMADLKGTLDVWVKAVFGPTSSTRLRPHFFPFTEPSAELDLRCFLCEGDGTQCRACGGTGWIEWGGCGMVHPNVLVAAGLDPEEFSGFAFGMGVERALQFRHGVTDLRDVVEGDVRFGRQFGLEV